MKDVRMFFAPEGRLRLEYKDQCYLEVKPIWASPLRYPDRYLALVDGKDREILMVTNPAEEFSPEMWQMVQAELHKRYLNGRIHRILSAKTEFGSTYWHVVTDRGEKEFVTQSLQENAQWLRENYLLVIDVDGNRFEIPDVDALDERSQKILNVTV